MNEKVAAGMGPSSHGSTFGGNPVVCAGANVVVDRMDASFLANVNERAVQLRAGLEKLPRVRSLSGIGLMVGIEFLEASRPLTCWPPAAKRVCWCLPQRPASACCRR